MKEKTLTTNLILILLSLVAVSMLLFDIGTLPLILAFVLMSMLVVRNLNDIKWKYILLIALCAVSCFCTLVLYQGTGVVLIFMTLLMACIAFNSISFSVNIRKYVSLITFIGILLVILTAKSISSTNGWLVVYDVNGNLINNNTLGIYTVAFCFNFLIWNDLRKGKKFKKLFAAVICVISFVFAYITGCRSAMLVLLLYFVGYLLIKKPLSNRLFKVIIISVLCASLAFTVIYIGLYMIWPNAIVLGKSIFSGRQKIWLEVFEQIKISPLFGMGTEFASGGHESVHNMLLGIWKNVGFIPLIAIITVFVLKKRVKISRRQQMMLISMCVFMFFESFMMDERFLLLFAFLMMGTKEIPKIEKES